MTRRRWIADEVSGNRAFLSGEHARHLSRVLRARPGQEFDIVTQVGVHRGTITSVTDERVEFELSGEVPAPAAPDITLAISIYKFDRMEWAIEKCTELGVARIVPILAHRTEPHLAHAAVKRRERWQRIALQAAEQSRRTSPPEITEPMKVKEVIALPGALRIVLDESEKEITLKEALKAAQSPLVLAFGPEGGWIEGELQQFHAAGWKSASLGDTILRAETAAIAATAIAVSELA
jgi:16S rRNA (uracil1498-N3)-methyltransferase